MDIKSIVKLRIEAVVFICGALLMALEIMGGRLLTPYYGDTVYVWGSVIGIFLLSLSLGYYFGGRLADKRPDNRTLAAVLIATGAFILLSPFLYPPVTGISNSFPRVLAPLFSITVLFFIPSLLLGMVSPFAIKLKAKTLRKIGKVSGNLYAISTMGSVIGTFSATFVFILLLPTKTVLLCLGATALLVSVLLLKSRQSLIMLAISLTVFFLSLYSAPIISSSPSSYTAGMTLPINGSVTFESLYGQVKVEQIGNERMLKLNGGVMSDMDMSNESRVPEGWMYVDCMTLPFVVNPEIKTVLTMGLGAGHFQRKLYREYNLDMDNVEINDKVVEVANKYFNLSFTDSFRVYIDDARAFLQRTNKTYDLIAIDVYHYDPSYGYKLPFHIATQEFFQLVKEHLNPNGVMALNIATYPASTFFSAEYKTINSVFPSITIFNCYTLIILASDAPTYSKEEFMTMAPDKAELIDGYLKFVPKNSSLILTDDYAPINPFGSDLVVNESIRGNLYNR